MVSYQKSIVKYGMGIFDNATKSCEKFRCFDEKRVRLFLLRGTIWNALRCASTGSSVVDAVCLYDPSRENGIAERPQNLSGQSPSIC